MLHSFQQDISMTYLSHFQTSGCKFAYQLLSSNIAFSRFLLNGEYSFLVIIKDKMKLMYKITLSLFCYFYSIDNSNGSLTHLCINLFSCMPLCIIKSSVACLSNQAALIILCSFSVELQHILVLLISLIQIPFLTSALSHLIQHFCFMREIFCWFPNNFILKGTIKKKDRKICMIKKKISLKK